VSTLAESALEYARHGWHVFPVKPRAKTPLVARGFLEATTNATTIAMWWTRWPDANIGLAPSVSGLVVLDIDGPEGEVAATRLGLYAEPTLSAKTGRADGGRHLFFRRPDFAVSNASLAPRLDVRCDAGYVLIAPSVHPSGQLYRWETKGIEPNELPQRALDALRQVQRSGAPVEPAAPIAAPIPDRITEGQRDATLFALAGALRRRGASEAVVVAALRGINRECVDPPLADGDLARIARSVSRYQPAESLVDHYRNAVKA